MGSFERQSGRFARLAAAAFTLAVSPMAAAQVTWADWWLPKNYSTHGWAADALFLWIFWITMIIFVAVEITLVVFLIKYRHKPGRKRAVFTHGNTRLEMFWTLAPAVILLGLSIFSKRVWDEYRYGPEGADAKRAQILVIGEQFKWNTIYPGPDGKLGRYLSYPKPSDKKYYYLSPDDAAREIDKDIRANPMGQAMKADDPNDPARDDDYAPGSAGRAMVIPVDTPLEILLSSRDVIHDYFLPNFRVKLDAVPGMMGRVLYTATKQSTKVLPLDQVPADKSIWLGPSVPNVTLAGLPPTFRIFDPDDPNESLEVKTIWVDNLDSLERAAGNRILRRDIAAAAKEGRSPIARDKIAKEALAAEVQSLRDDLRSLGIKELSFVDQPFEVVCEELCGQGHGQMNNLLIVLSQQEYDDFINKAARGPTTPAKRMAPMTQPIAQPETAASQPTTAASN